MKFKCVFLLATMPCVAFSQQIPSAADSSRIDPVTIIENKFDKKAFSLPTAKEIEDSAPEGSDKIRIDFNGLRLEGITVFTEEEISALYKDKIGSTILLSELWSIAADITTLYHRHGYFLSRTIVPAQEIVDGKYTIKIVEGYISKIKSDDVSLKKHPVIRGIEAAVGQVVVDKNISNHRLVKALLEELMAQKPVSVQTLESTLLRLNDLAGISVNAVILPVTDQYSGAVEIRLVEGKPKSSGQIILNNQGSRFLGPYQVNFIYQDDILPLQETSLSLSQSIQTEELRYIAVSQKIPLSTRFEMKINGSVIKAEPGHTLEPTKLENDSYDIDANITYQPIRQRHENLSLHSKFALKNTNGDIFDAPLTRDRIRTAEIGIAYDVADGWLGANYIRADIRRGLELFEASDEGDLNLSREEAVPDFTALNVSYTRYQSIDSEWQLVADLDGQVASDPLFSSEEFGYGGSRFGRAYDPSELTGDHGFSASAELRYFGVSPVSDVQLMPFIFYDGGRVWNLDDGIEQESETAMSTGVGLRLQHDIGASAMLGIAFPVKRSAENPLYGDGRDPRFMFDLSYQF